MALFWVQAAGWTFSIIAAIGVFLCVIRSVRLMHGMHAGPWLRNFGIMFGFMALGLVGITLTLIGPQQF